ncbi:MAG TPA: alpha/beta hydrolase [Pyrinomonadaceae bacterium]|nr:alpha/beta hydrolase [Pyrinomonadaceae bacterium]
MAVEYLKQGSGSPFIYVSGVDGTGKLFYKQAKDLARDHTVVTFPLRGEGRYKMERLVEDLAWVVRDAGFERATFLGESFGGLLVMATALARPEMFERMILVNTFPYFTHRAKIALGVVLFSLLPYPLMKAHRTRAARHVLFSSDVSDEDRRLFRQHTGVVPFEGYLSRLKIIRETDLRDRLHEIKVPALVVAGTADRLLDSVGAAKMMAARLPRARLKLLPGTGHTALLSERVRVREWLAEFDSF